MQKLNFNNAGLQQLLQQLYALPDPLLQQEALAIQNDFSEWLKVHFLFSNSQEADLDEIDPVYLEDSASQMAHFVQNRLAVSLYQQHPPLAAKGQDRGKLYRTEQSQSLTSSSLLGSGQVYTLSFIISYLEPGNS